MVAPKLKFLQLLHFIELFRQSCQLTLHMLSCGPLLWTWREHVGTWWCINRWLWNGYFKWAVVVTQLVERSLPTPEVHGSNPVIGKLLYGTFVHCQLYWKDENKETEARNGSFLTICVIFFIPTHLGTIGYLHFFWKLVSFRTPSTLVPLLKDTTILLLFILHHVTQYNW